MHIHMVINLQTLSCSRNSMLPLIPFVRISRDGILHGILMEHQFFGLALSIPLGRFAYNELIFDKIKSTLLNTALCNLYSRRFVRGWRGGCKRVEGGL